MITPDRRENQASASPTQTTRNRQCLHVSIDSRPAKCPLHPDPDRVDTQVWRPFLPGPG